MKRSDLDTLAVLGIIGETAPGQRPSAAVRVSQAYGMPEKVVLAKLLQLARQGLIEYVVITRPRLTPEGKAVLAEGRRV